MPSPALVAVADDVADGSFQARAGAWHRQAVPASTAALVALKGCEEMGEVARAFHGRGSVPGEAADVVVAMMVLVGRWYPGSDLLALAEEKLEAMIAGGSVYALGDGAPGTGAEPGGAGLQLHGEVGGFGGDGQEGSTGNQHVDNFTRPGGQLPETRSGETTGTSVQGLPVDPVPSDLGRDTAEPFDLLDPEGIPGGKVTAAGVVRVDGEPWACTCGTATRTIGQMRQHRLGVGLRRDDHRLVPVPDPEPDGGLLLSAVDQGARRTVERSVCPLCGDAGGITGPDELMAHLAVDHKLGGRSVCSCGKSYRTDGYHRGHVSGIRDVRGDLAAGCHLIVLRRDYRPPLPPPCSGSSPARAVPQPGPEGRHGTGGVGESDGSSRAPAAWVPSASSSKPLSAEDRDRLVERRRRRAGEAWQ